jgi:hypothetical protein
LGRYQLRSAVDKREGDLAGEKQPNEEERRKTISLFLFSDFKQFWLFANL